jgi:hypothetical protein
MVEKGDMKGFPPHDFGGNDFSGSSPSRPPPRGGKGKGMRHNHYKKKNLIPPSEVRLCKES